MSTENPGPHARWCPRCGLYRYNPLVRPVMAAQGFTLSGNCAYVPTCYKCHEIVIIPATYNTDLLPRTTTERT